MVRQAAAGNGCRRVLACAGMMLAALALAGCEGGGGEKWDDFDFGANNKAVCVALGDSITAGSALDNYAQCYVPKLAAMLQKTIVNRAVPGTETSYGVDIVHSALDANRPGFLIILYGINDLIMGYSETAAINNLRTMVRAAKENKTVPIIATLTPVTGKRIGLASAVIRLNAAIRQMALEEEATLADLNEALAWNPNYMLADGLHPGPVGNDIMAETFRDVMQ